jgi:hypothetical protein
VRVGTSCLPSILRTLRSWQRLCCWYEWRPFVWLSKSRLRQHAGYSENVNCALQHGSEIRQGGGCLLVSLRWVVMGRQLYCMVRCLAPCICPHR